MITVLFCPTRSWTALVAVKQAGRASFDIGVNRTVSVFDIERLFQAAQGARDRVVMQGFILAELRVVGQDIEHFGRDGRFDIDQAAGLAGCMGNRWTHC